MSPGAGNRESEPPVSGSRRRHRVLATGGVLLVVAGAVTAAVVNPFRPAEAEDGAAAAQSTDPTATATVVRRSLSSQTQISGTLGYAGSYAVTVLSAAGNSGSSATAGGGQATGSGGQATGSGGQATAAGQAVFTALPAIGQVVGQGHALYSVSGSPVVLLYGTIPAYRTLTEGVSGADVAELNADLVALGYASRAAIGSGSSYFGAVTASGIQRLQASLGETQTGTLSLGQAVFLPTPAKVTSVIATLGAPAQPGSQVLQATSTTRQVTAQLDADEQTDVAPGQQVTITLPSGQTTSGRVTSVGTVAATPPGSGQGGGGTGNQSDAPPTLTVDVKPDNPAATGALDQAPVQVTITTGTVPNALVVPVDALLAQPSGYAVEVAGSHRLVPVTPGLFDDADGLVQVENTSLRAGQSVVVPQT